MYTHRTRSFLFVALAAVTARLFGKTRCRFFENGVDEFNLDFSNARWSGRRTGPSSGNSVVRSIGLGGYLTRFASRASGDFRPPAMRVHQGARQHGDEQAWCFRCVVWLRRS